jgi:hypothetical protein
MLADEGQGNELVKEERVLGTLIREGHEVISDKGVNEDAVELQWDIEKTLDRGIDLRVAVTLLNLEAS